MLIQQNLSWSWILLSGDKRNSSLSIICAHVHICEVNVSIIIMFFYLFADFSQYMGDMDIQDYKAMAGGTER